MSKLVGVGAIKESDNKEIALLTAQVEELTAKNTALETEKEELAKQVEELTAKVKTDKK